MMEIPENRVHNRLRHIDDELSLDYFEDNLHLVEQFVLQHKIDVGAWRPHKHFDLSPGEVVLTTPLAAEKELHVSVVPFCDLPADAIPYVFKFDAGKWKPTQWVTPLPGGEEFATLAAMNFSDWSTDSMTSALNSLGEELASQCLQDSVGLSLNCGFFTDMMETTNESERSQKFVQKEKWVQPDEDGKSLRTHVFFKGPWQHKCHFQMECWACRDRGHRRTPRHYDY